MSQHHRKCRLCLWVQPGDALPEAAALVLLQELVRALEGWSTLPGQAAPRALEQVLGQMARQLVPRGPRIH